MIFYQNGTSSCGVLRWIKIKAKEKIIRARFGHVFQIRTKTKKGASLPGLLHAANGNGTLGNPGMCAKKVKVICTMLLHERL